MTSVDETGSRLSDWQQISLTHLNGRDHWMTFCRIVLFTPVLWIHWPISVLISRGSLQGHNLLLYICAILFYCGTNSLAMLPVGRHRINLLAWIAVPAFTSLLTVPAFYSFTAGSPQGLEKSLGPLMASNICSGALAWLLATRVLPWLAEMRRGKSQG